MFLVLYLEHFRCNLTAIEIDCLCLVRVGINVMPNFICMHIFAPDAIISTVASSVLFEVL